MACICAKLAIGKRVDDALGPSHDGNIGAAQPQHVQAERDRLVARRAGRHGRVRPSSGSEPQADVGCRGVGHQHRDRQRADPTSAFLFLDIPVGKQRDHPADAGGDGDAEPLAVDWVVLPQPVSGVLPGLQGGDHRQLRAAVEPARLDAFQDLGRIDGCLCRDLDRQISGPVGFDPCVRRTCRPIGRPTCVGTSPPSGVVAPRPVTTTRMRDIAVTPAMACRVVWLISGPSLVRMAPSMISGGDQAAARSM